MPAAVVYNPTERVSGWEYYSVERLFRVLHERCDRVVVLELCEEALSRQPVGLELRNLFLLQIRANLQEWKAGETLATMLKTMLTRLLNDSVSGGVFDYELLTLDTLIAFDPSKMLERGLEDGNR